MWEYSWIKIVADFDGTRYRQWLPVDIDVPYPMSPASLDIKLTVSKMVSDMNCTVSESSHIRTDIPKSKLSLILITKIHARCNDNGNEISIKKKTQTLTVLHKPSDRKIKWQRKQFPCVPGIANTLHKAQGLTLKAFAIFLEDFMESSTLFLTYVATTRPQHFEDLFICEEILKECIFELPPQAVREDHTRIERLQARTKRELRQSNCF